MDADASASARSLGGLLTAEVERVPLGTHHGHLLHARVRRRRARLSAGHRWQLSIDLGRTQPEAIEVMAQAARLN